MKRLVPFFLVMTTLAMSSCQKELGPLTDETIVTPPVTDPDTVKPVTGSDLLVKLQRDFSYNSGDKESRTAQFTWNSNKKLMKYAETGTDADENAVSIHYRFERDANDKVTKAVQYDFPEKAGVDSIVYSVTYQSGTEKLAYVKDVQYAQGFILKDSIVYVYDGNGRVSQKETYFAVGLNGVLAKNTRQVYTYDSNGNLTKLVQAAYNSADNIYVQSATYNYTYGAYKTPMQLGVEAFIVSSLTDWISPYYTSASVQRTETGTYTYDFKTALYTSTNKPVQVAITQSQSGGTGNGSGTLTCTYQ